MKMKITYDEKKTMAIKNFYYKMSVLPAFWVIKIR